MSVQVENRFRNTIIRMICYDPSVDVIMMQVVNNYTQYIVDGFKIGRHRGVEYY